MWPAPVLLGVEGHPYAIYAIPAMAQRPGCDKTLTVMVCPRRRRRTPVSHPTQCTVNSN
jgi:hypothetical protein